MSLSVKPEDGEAVLFGKAVIAYSPWRGTINTTTL